MKIHAGSQYRVREKCLHTPRVYAERKALVVHNGLNRRQKVQIMDESSFLSILRAAYKHRPLDHESCTPYTSVLV
jgi:hypothetical protein